jgi:SAM-dependent methyltransferase
MVTHGTGIDRHGGSHVPSGKVLRREIERLEYRRGDHIQRYQFASRNFTGAEVLDMGCGHGFGALYLANTARHYVGVDPDREALQWARTVVQGEIPRAEFLDPESLRSRGDTAQFDAVVLLEVIEHVTDPVSLLAYCRRLLMPSGRLILSTPNGYLSQGSSQLFQSPFHVREFRTDEIERMLADVGFGGRVYVQYRLDHVDSLQQVAKRALLGGLRARTDGSLPRIQSRLASDEPLVEKSRFASLYRIYEIGPSWERLWRTRPADDFQGPPWGFTHIVAVADKRP